MRTSGTCKRNSETCAATQHTTSTRLTASHAHATHTHTHMQLPAEMSEAREPYLAYVALQKSSQCSKLVSFLLPVAMDFGVHGTRAVPGRRSIRVSARTSRVSHAALGGHTVRVERDDLPPNPSDSAATTFGPRSGRRQIRKGDGVFTTSASRCAMKLNQIRLDPGPKRRAKQRRAKLKLVPDCNSKNLREAGPTHDRTWHDRLQDCAGVRHSSGEFTPTA